MLCFPDEEAKFKTVIEKNTFFFRDVEFEEERETYISSLVQNLLILKHRVEREGVKEEVFVEYIMSIEDGLDALLTLTGFSERKLLRLITFIRVLGDEELNKIVNKKYWPEEEFKGEWRLEKIKRYVRNNRKVAEGIVNLFFKGATVPVLRKLIPLFEFKKLDINKLNFSTESLIDTIVRYKISSLTRERENNPEVVIEEVLTELCDTFERKGSEFMIPSKESPKIIVECSYEITPISLIGGKVKIAQKQRIAKAIKKYYPGALFVGFVDGFGWYVEREDLERIVKAYDFVFTFKKEEIERFKELLTSVMGLPRSESLDEEVCDTDED